MVRTGCSHLSCNATRVVSAGSGGVSDGALLLWAGLSTGERLRTPVVTGRGHTEAMHESQPQRPTCARLAGAAAALASYPTLGSVRVAVAAAWKATSSVGQPASPADALRWLRLVEALPAIWSDLAALSGTAPVSHAALPVPPMGISESADTAALEDAVVRLIRAAAAALRGLAEAGGSTDPDRGLWLALISDLLDGAVEDWP